MDYSFNFISEKIGPNKLKIKMFDNNNHSLSDLSKLILIRTSFDGKNDEIEIKINNSNFNNEKNKIYFILDFFDYEFYQIKNIYNKNNMMIESFLKTEKNIFRLNEIRKLDDISFSPNSFQLLEAEKVVIINYSEPCTNDNFSLKLKNTKTDYEVYSNIYINNIYSKLRFKLTVSTRGIYNLELYCNSKIILKNNLLYKVYKIHYFIYIIPMLL